MIKKQSQIREALIRYANDRYHRPDNQLTAKQWLRLLNGFCRDERPESVAMAMRIAETEVRIWYCRLSIAITAHAMELCRQARVLYCGTDIKRYKHARIH